MHAKLSCFWANCCLNPICWGVIGAFSEGVNCLSPPGMSSARGNGTGRDASGTTGTTSAGADRCRGHFPMHSIGGDTTRKTEGGEDMENADKVAQTFQTSAACLPVCVEWRRSRWRGDGGVGSEASNGLLFSPGQQDRKIRRGTWPTIDRNASCGCRLPGDGAQPPLLCSSSC